MLRDVFYYGQKPNVHPREQYAKDLKDARKKAKTPDFWIINEFCDYKNFDWDFDFEFLPDDEVWTQDHNNIWPSNHQRDSGTWLCPKKHSEVNIYRNDVDPIKRKNIKSDCWVEHDLIDSLRWDFTWHPDPSSPPYIYKWGSKFAPVEFQCVLEYRTPGATQIKYMANIVELLPQTDRWLEVQPIDKSKFDLSWRPDPMDPPLIYVWGNKFIDPELKSTLEYHVPGATVKKYMAQRLEVLPETERWNVVQPIVKSGFDLSWRPDPREPAYIYTWGNKWVEAEFIPTIEYHCPGATERKYMTNDVPVLPQWERWNIIEDVIDGSFDFSWRPDPREPALIYVFGNDQYDAVHMPTIEYHMPDATERKYILDTNLRAKLKPSPDRFEHLEDSYLEDYSWTPDPKSPPYIYAFGNQWNKPEDKISIQYVVQGATEYKYMDVRAIRKPCMDNWQIPEYVDTEGFDFSWEPSPKDPPYIYEFGTQWQKTGGPRYVVEGATEIKYVSTQKVKALINPNANWTIPPHVDVTDFDFSWHPDNTSPPYIYHFATQWALTGGPIYTCDGATEKKYLETQQAKALPNKENWVIPTDIDANSFDFSWHPYIEDQPYIYVFATQHQKTGGPKYMTPGVTGSSPVKYIDARILRSTRLPNKSRFTVLGNCKIKDFDWSWHPDDTEEPYIYVFGNTQHPAEEMPTIEYAVPGATQIKYVKTLVATLDENLDNWIIPDNVDTTGFDFSWVPNPKDPPYIYQFGTQHQKTGGPKFVVEGATEIKYVSTYKVKALPRQDDKRWQVPKHLDISEFDFSWHPDDTDPAYIYQFGTQWALTGGPKFVMPDAKEVKYVDNPIAKALPSKENWVIPADVDVDSFDFSWHPYVEDQPYVYVFGTQWQKTGGPRYVTPGATGKSPVKYIDTRILKAKRLPNKLRFTILDNLKIKDFDFSWHPDERDDPYVYVFGNQYYPGQTMPTIEYRVAGAKSVKYIEDIKATLDQDTTNWEIPFDVDVTNFDFSWKPNPRDPEYIYEFGTQWQKTGGPRYIVEGATDVKYIDTQKAKRLPDRKNWIVPENVDIDSFDFSWHPDNTELPYIYEFGTQWQKTGGPRYVVEGATEIKYVDAVKAKRLPNMDNWIVPDNIKDFDYSWHPDDTEPPYVYEFATVWNDRGGPVYTVPGATEKKYIDGIKATLKINKTNWEIPNGLDTSNFDFSWVPHPKAPAYIYQFGTQWQKTGGPIYKDPTISSDSPIKYVDTQTAKHLPNKKNFKVLNKYSIANFDYSWHPDNTDEPYIYVFGNTQYSAEEMPTIEYRLPGATTRKYINDVKAKLAGSKKNYKNLLNEDVEFDWGWIPHPASPPYIYVFGNQWNSAEIEPTLEYVVEGATDKKYINDAVATILPNKSRFKMLHPVDEKSFDFSWRPNPYDPPYIYAFGNQWFNAEKMPTILYRTLNATEYKYVNDIVPKLKQNRKNWKIPKGINVKEFDFSWVPDPDSPPYIYEFATTWNNRGGPKYVVEGAKEYKYIEDIKAKYKPSKEHWVIPDNVDVDDFDFTWRPHPEAPPYIYQFGTLQNDVDGPRYETPGNKGEIVKLERVYKIEEEVTEVTEEIEDEVIIEINRYYIETTLEDLVNQHPDEVFWALRTNINYDKFNFNWRPKMEQAKYVQVFGSPDSEETQTYFLSATMYLQGNKDFNFVTKDKLSEEYLASLFKQPDIFIVDKGNVEANDRYLALKTRFPNIQKTRFLNSWVDTIKRCINRSNTELCWILNSELDYSRFNFNFYPNPWQTKLVHIFGTQWGQWGTTFMVNRDTFAEDTKYIPVIEHLDKKLNFVKDKKATATNNLYDMILINHDNPELVDVESLLKYKAQGKSVKVVKYENSYLETIKNIVKDLPEKKDHYMWICSSVCDYTAFDFSYICDPFAKDNLHVFASDKQKFGDTFLIDINRTREIINDIEELQDYKKVNYNQSLRVSRLPAPVIISHSDTHVQSVKNTKFNFPYAIFATEKIDIVDQEPISLWDNETKNIVITSTGASRIIVPREVKDKLTDQLYDYPYIKTSSKLSLSKPLDIVYLSNGEKCADENYEHLLEVTKGLKNRIIRVDGINGRVEAYHAASHASNTAWAFTVFAKLKVNPKFDFNWQPDRLQIPKHYIFHAKNPVNGLEYGHQGMIAYNKKLVLNNWGEGLDFTLDSPHETVELLSGVANFNTDEFSTWRTAFREVIKLKSDVEQISQERLEVWLNRANGDFAEYCLLGAKDAVEYYSSVSGDIEQLKLSYEWDWLIEYYNRKYK